MRISKLSLKNFRCFSNQQFTFSKPIVLIEGDNGSGKTSLLEALYYACYLRSFRTRRGNELVQFNNKHFFIQIELEDQQEIQVGFSDNSKVVKLDKKRIKAYKELVDHYRVIVVAEDDLSLIKGAPENRRSFLDQALSIRDNSYITDARKYKQILNNRNNLILRSQSLTDELTLWSKQLFEQSKILKNKRIEYLENLGIKINKLMRDNFQEDITVNLSYKTKVQNCKFDLFWNTKGTSLLNDELKYKRSMYGAHLDDFLVEFMHKKAKIFASRGQQKLIVFLMKMAQFELLKDDNRKACILLDDFLTDLDQKTFSTCIDILTNIGAQVFITSPLKGMISKCNIPNFSPEIIKL